MSAVTDASKPAKKPGGAGILWGILLLVASVVVGVAGVIGIAVAGVNSVSDLLDSPKMTVPGSSSFTLEPGTWVIYEPTGTSRVGSPTTRGLTSLRPSDVTVTGPNGNDVPTGIPGGTQTVTVGSTIYTAAVSFPVDTTGSYRIRIDDVDSGTVLVGKSVFDQFKTIGLWLFAFLFSGLLFLIGLIVLIVGIVRRSSYNRDQRRRGPPGMAPPGMAPPGMAPPGMAPPGYAPPGYGPPGYGPPGTPAPPQPQPGWGPPSYPPPQAPPYQPPQPGS